MRLALKQIPPRVTNSASRGNRVQLAKISYKKYFLQKVRAARTGPYFEKTALEMLGAVRLKESR
jgi:hypothetical protein